MCKKCFTLMTICLAVCLSAGAGYAARIPIPSGFPKASTTGLAGVGLTVNDLTTYTGPMTITTNGTTIDKKDITGQLNIQANNVTVKRCRVRNGGNYGIHASYGYTGTVIEDCLIYHTSGGSGKAILPSNTTVRRCDISMYKDCIYFGSNVTLEDNYCHDLYYEPGFHNDCMQTTTGSNVTIKHNTLQGRYQGQTSAIGIHHGGSDNVMIDDNFLSGGGYTLYIRKKDGEPANTNVTVKNNVFEKDSYFAGPVSYEDNPTFLCNTFHTGEPIPQNPPCAGGNQLPVADAGPDQQVTDTDDNGSELVGLDGSGSYDPDGSITSYVWKKGTTQIATGVSPDVTLNVGSHTVTLTVTDNDSATDTDNVVINVSPASDTTAPSPDPMTWNTVPYAIGGSSIRMIATTATDASGVEYYFDCTTTGGHDSGWQDSTIYIDTGLSTSTQYSYQVEARDKSTNQNETAYSTLKSATTESSTAVTSTTGWQNFSITSQSGSLIFEFDATPNLNSMNGLCGVLYGTADEWADLACIFRFNAYGNMDVRNGASYDADVTLPYSAGTNYYVEMDINIPAHKYSVYVTPEGQSEVTLASAYDFRTDQSGVTSLDHWALMHVTGSLTVDNVEVTTGGGDTTAPSPNPMTWSTEPYATGTSSISMTATTATDASGVEYYFDCTAGGGNDSGWQSGATYEDTGLSASTQYTYRVRARDKSSNQNETAYSTTKSATTQAADDTTAPSPDPMTWSTDPYATGSTSISMTATTATDTSGVEYYFDCTITGGHDSSWQDSTTYEDTGLDPNSQYGYRVRARDKSTNQNETGWSTTKSATTDTAADIEFDAVSSNSSNVDGTTLSWSHSVGSGDNRILIVGIGGEDSSSSDLNISSVKYNNVSMNLVTGSSATAGTNTLMKTELYYLLEADLPTSGAYTATVTYSGFVSARTGGTISLANVKQQTAEAVENNTVTSQAAISTNITTLTDGAWVVDAIGCGNPGGGYTTTTSGMVERYDENSGYSTGAGSTKAVATAGSTTMSWLYGDIGNRQAHSVAAFAPVSQAPPDTAAPSPDPMTWVTQPYATGGSSISMTATTATDSSGVEYYFECTAGGGHDSSWQDSATYEDTGLSELTEYTYRVKARDKSTNQNETAYSTVKSATTQDATAPSPNPMTWASEPQATGTTSIAMTATTATDTSGVEYYFDCTTAGGHDSGWQDGTSYEDTGLNSSTTYNYQVKARDKSSNQNETTYSTLKSATTDTVVVPPPSPTGYWKLDETSGTTAADSSGYAYDGTVSGATWTSSGHTDGALSFSSTTDRCEIPGDALSASKGTVALWARASGTQSGTRYFFGHTSEPNAWANRIQLYMDNDDMALDLGLGDTHAKDTGIMTLSTDTWYYIALTWDSEDYVVYVDAVQKATGSYTGLGTIGSLADIGNNGSRSTTPDQGFAGRIDDVRIFDKTLDPDEVNEIYSGVVFVASSPSPADDANNVSVDAVLSWTAGAYVASHDVYLGTNYNSVADANHSSSEYKGAYDTNSFDPNTFDPNLLAYNTTYYWAVDEVNGTSFWMGDIWGFTTESESGDSTAPSPDPMTWATEPYATGTTSISMTATTATDSSGVEYYFECTAGGGNSSSWQDSTSYTDTGLSASTQYTYQVKVRDKSSNQNETSCSTTKSATTDAAGQDLEFGPSDDSYVRSSSPSSNFGSYSDMRMRSGTKVYYGYLKFTVSGAEGTVTSAKLKLYSLEATSNLSAWACTGSWDEDTITWNNDDLSWGGSALDTKSSITANTWYEFDVSDSVTGNGTYTFGLKSTDTSACEWATKETAYDPVLLVETNGGE